jgi:hypothetical protein
MTWTDDCPGDEEERGRPSDTSRPARHGDVNACGRGNLPYAHQRLRVARGARTVVPGCNGFAGELVDVRTNGHEVTAIAPPYTI